MPRRKSPGQRQRSNSPELGLVETGPVQPPDAPHPATSPLLEQTLEAWETFWASDLGQLVNDSDRPALVRLFRMYDMRERMERVFAVQPFAEGSTGQLVIHPAAKEIASLDGRILALEDRFGITPMARLKLGVTFGSAARSLEELNRGFDDEAGKEGAGEEDPRLRVIDTTAAG